MSFEVPARLADLAALKRDPRFRSSVVDLPELVNIGAALVYLEISNPGAKWIRETQVRFACGFGHCVLPAGKFAFQLVEVLTFSSPALPIRGRYATQACPGSIHHLTLRPRRHSLQTVLC